MKNLAIADRPRSASNKCISDDTKAAARQSRNCIKKQKMNEIRRKKDFQYGGLNSYTPCNVARS